MVVNIIIKYSYIIHQCLMFTLTNYMHNTYVSIYNLPRYKLCMKTNRQITVIKREFLNSIFPYCSYWIIYTIDFIILHNILNLCVKIIQHEYIQYIIYYIISIILYVHKLDTSGYNVYRTATHFYILHYI